MRILAAADIHGSQYRLNIILKNIEKYSPDLVIICGDITQFGPGETAKNFLGQIEADAVAISGNIDTPDVDQAITESKADNIDLKKVVKNSLSFVGIGGNISSQLSKIVIQNKDSEKPLEESIDEKTVLVSHVPPFKTQDRVFFGHHSGSRELRKLVDKCKPRLVLCGHIHEDPGVTKLDGSIVVNCSIGKRTEGALIEINDKINVKILD
ncbi:MAG: metallophosphoesterase family protein [Thermoplasmatales archaeon]|nr:MAG: metallophosphoesterase family protein [Thermoplasmatales archaeon]